MKVTYSNNLSGCGVLLNNAKKELFSMISKQGYTSVLKFIFTIWIINCGLNHCLQLLIELAFLCASVFTSMCVCMCEYL